MLYCKKSNYSAKEVFMKISSMYVSELSSAKHVFNNYHFCRGNSNRRKTRLGVIVKGNGSYIYLDKRLEVTEGAVVFIPENIYCYSEWRGDPTIEVVYVSCFMHYDSFSYEPQIISTDKEITDQILQIAELLSADEQTEILEAYARFYHLLQVILPKMTPSNITFGKTLQDAIEYITNHYDKKLSVAELAKKCCISESTLYHLFQKELGQSPVKFLNSIRINIAIEYLENANYSVSTISRLVGFSSENHFRKIFFEFTGSTPLKFRKSRQPSTT